MDWVPQMVLSHRQQGVMDQAEEPGLLLDEFEEMVRARRIVCPTVRSTTGCGTVAARWQRPTSGSYPIGPGALGRC